MGPRVAVVALQGDVREHARALADAGAMPVEARVPSDLAGADAVILPGGESTTMSLLLGSSGLFDALAERLDDGLPAFGTCAGMILLARDVLDGRPDQRGFGLMDITVRRNGTGRQVDSGEADIAVAGLRGHCREGAPFRAVFIRAPVVEATGAGVEVLARDDGGHPVLCRQGRLLAASFHPELTGDGRLHELFLEGI
jgi:pyridoxal 5'-phosphate synthase pdxT subunit